MKKKILIFLFLLGTVELPAQTIVQELFSVGGPSHISDMDVKAPTSEGSILIAMPGPLATGIKVLGINDMRLVEATSISKFRRLPAHVVGKYLWMFGTARIARAA